MYVLSKFGFNLQKFYIYIYVSWYLWAAPPFFPYTYIQLSHVHPRLDT